MKNSKVKNNEYFSWSGIVDLFNFITRDRVNDLELHFDNRLLIFSDRSRNVIEELSELLTANYIIEKVKRLGTSLKNLYNNVPNIRPSNIRRITYLLIFLTGIYACTATKQRSLFDSNLNLLTKQYTPDEIAQIEQKFEADPLQYSNEIGNLMFWKISQKSHVLAQEIGKVAMFKDGIKPEEANGLIKYFGTIKDSEFPEDFAKSEKDQMYSKFESNKNEYEISIKWYGPEGNYSGRFIAYDRQKPDLISITPNQFEEGDTIDQSKWKAYRVLKWKSKIQGDDIDGVVTKILGVNSTRYSVLFDESHTRFPFYILDLYNGDLHFERTNGFKGKLTVSLNKGNGANLLNPVQILEDMVFPSVGRDTHSTALNYLLGDFKDGKFDGNKIPYAGYPGWLNYITQKWNKMERFKGKKPENILKNLTHPRLFVHYMNASGNKYKRIYYPQRSKKTISSGYHDCKAYSIAGYDALKPVKWDVSLLTMDHYRMDGHTVLLIKTKKGLYTVDNRMGLKGPYVPDKKNNAIEKILDVFGYSGKEYIIENGRGHMLQRFR